MNDELIIKTKELKLLIVRLEGLKLDIEYLKEKLRCTEQDEKALRTRLYKNELRLELYRIAPNLVTNHHNLYTENQEVEVDLDYNVPMPKEVGVVKQSKNERERKKRR